MNKVKLFLKRHIALFIVIVIVFVFPVSLTSQAKLNMRVIVTGIAIDKGDDGYEVTAQIVKSTPGTESPGTSASIDFITEKGETISLALARLMYRSGKVSAFSHTSFVVIGEDVAKEDAASCLDVFIRDKVIRNSAMVLFAEGKAGDEIQKTKNIELSVGLGLQKVFLFKQEESDGLMTTVLQFLNESNMNAKTTFASVLSLGSNEEGMSGSQGESSEENGGESGGSSGEGSGSSGSSSGGGGQGSGSSGGSSGSSGSSSSGSSGGQEGPMYFKGNAPVLVFTNGKLACKLEEDDELLGFMISSKKTKRFSISVKDIENEELKDVKVSIEVKNKTQKRKVRFEEEIPVLDITIEINDAEIVEVLSNKKHSDTFGDKYEAISKALQSEISRVVAKAFEKTKEAKTDMLGAYGLAYKYSYKTTMKYYPNPEDFISKLKLNVSVNINKMDF